MMRYLFLAFLLLVLGVLSVAGFRGSMSRRTPIELFADMKRQPKLRPEAPNNFFADRLSSRLPVAGTVPQSPPASIDGREVYPYEDAPYNTGRLPGKTNFIETLPVPVTAQLLARGQERYTIHCAVCHGAAGDGKGVIAKYQMVGMANFHDQRLVGLPDGDLFNTITHGSRALIMSAYGPNVDVADRWAIVAYVRALQRSWLGTLDDVPESMRSTLKK
jgi:mono/diheme cytochrome c family protein